MKHLTTILLSFSCIYLLAQPNIKQIEKLIENGDVRNCYYTKPLDSTITEKVYFEIEPDNWKLRHVTTNELIKEQHLEEELQSNTSNYIEIMVSPPHEKIVRREGNPGNPCPGIKTTAQFSNRNAITVCLVEVPPRYKRYTKSSMVKDGKTINIIKDEKIAVRELVQLGKVHFMTAEEAQSSTNRNIFEVYTGEWTDLTQSLCGTCPTKNIIPQIQQKLIELGYEIEANGIFDATCREAIIDFQQKNGLREGRLDMDTLKALGIDY